MNYFSKIDGLRGFLVLHVVVFHFKGWIPPLGNSDNWLQIFLNNGVHSPFYFFVISGFLIVNSYKHGISEKSATWKSFYAKRFFRIFPVLWVTILLSLLLKVFPYSSEVIKNAFLVSFLTPYLLEKIPVFVSWSIFVEMTYYLVTPLIAKRMSLLFAFVGMLLFIFFQKNYYEYRHQFYNFDNLSWDMPMTTFSYLFGGIFIYYLNLGPYFHKTYWPRLNGLLVDVITLALFVQVIVTNGRGTLLTGIFLLMTALIETSLIGRIIWDQKSLQYFGTRCYSIYLTHMISIHIAHKVHFDIFNDLSITDRTKLFSQYLWILLVVIVIAELVYRSIEKPWIQYGKKLTY